MIVITRNIIALIAFSAAIIFGTAGIIGLFRFPDPYSKLQAGSLCGTTAVFSIFIGSLALAPTWAMAGRIIIICFFFLLSSPTGAHIVARFAWHSNIVPWKPAARKHRKRKNKKQDPLQ